MAAWELSIIIQRLVTKLQRGGRVTLRRSVERLLGSRQHPNSEWAAKLVSCMIAGRRCCVPPHRQQLFQIGECRKVSDCSEKLFLNQHYLVTW